ncbi:MAG: lysine--tRNA ligase, partial [Armatimonadetes bacterium]|nr:lysine--tRNA ligase [Armatimonadota bacterium]
MFEQETLNEQILQRKKHLEELYHLNLNPYGERFFINSSILKLLEKYQNLSPGENKTEEISIAGRLMALREHGKATFGNIADLNSNIQIYFRENIIGKENYKILKYLDLGDILGLSGEIFRTHKGELTIAVKKFKILSKALHPLPEKWHGLKDPELRYRQRYLDLIINPKIKELFSLRSKIISEVRNFLDIQGFIEVETPVMSLLAGGASARPFTTFHNALKLNLYLRIATELYLKRCIVGGLEKVYEIGRTFRNEGISTKHNPEFTMLELYEAYSDYHGMMEITENLINHLAKNVIKNYEIQFKKDIINLKPPYSKITYTEALKKFSDLDLDKLRNYEFAVNTAKKLGISMEGASLTHLLDKIFEIAVEPHLIQPTFILDYPIELSPLAKKKEDDPNLTYRFELFIANFEIANAFSELNDPQDQRKRFEEQLELKASGDEETHPMDEDYLQALEYGMPPTGGIGIGIDRLIMLFTT